eukprot:GHUV01014005.1.p1 GENE.GHUV01014005.1~~GHUV01014005.1.p1  ORF type:complete len:832 (+),score=111.45 GHUV01014005.1:893-3388(+)
MLLLPLLTFAVLCTCGVLGVVLGANRYEQELRDRAESAAIDWSASFRMSAEKVFTPLVTLSMVIQLDPSVDKLRTVFPGIASQLFKLVNGVHNIVQELQVSPMGIIEMIYPLNEQTDAGLGLNIFNQPALRGGALKTIEAHDIVLNGPLHLVNSNFAMIGRIPILIKNSTLQETFGGNLSMPYNCTDLCYNPATHEKFWGFATAISPLDDLKAGNDSRLGPLKQSHYNWLMTRPYTSTEKQNPALTARNGQFVFANSTRWPSQNAVKTDIHIANAAWEVYLEPQSGWRPSWEKGLIAVAVLCSFVVAVLVATIMASWAQQQKLLGDVMASNKQLADTTAKLQDEKLRLDALLVRQYNLVAVLAGNKGASKRNGSGGSDGLDGSTETSKEGLTLERIETMRRQLAVNTNTSLQDIGSIQTIELLGEGTFGKVYKGLWRGTVVAVKTMLLPSNMSGCEKREKMAVMEAAISSSLSHPNIVQTYTYAIRPILEAPPEKQGLNESMTASLSTADCDSLRSSTSMSGLHSYEVRLVLEFCDKGCLRDALDDGVFILPDGGLNYWAVCDTAADVAKAMLHLHSLNVLHSDLKSHNVMLQTGNADGRGLVAKVCDFGLSLKMDHAETHLSNVYQGTMTHMAPEIMLSGRVSKAADVYSFGITLWEMYTGRRAFEGIPRALLGHQITREALRPGFPEGTPQQYRELAERCWEPRWEDRPSFAEVLAELLRIRSMDHRPTPPLEVDPRAYRIAGTAAGPASPLQLDAQCPQLPTVPGQGLRSVYLEHSAEDSDVIVMRTMSDWSDSPSAASQGSIPTSSFLRDRRSMIMPQIAEADVEST